MLQVQLMAAEIHFSEGQVIIPNIQVLVGVEKLSSQAQAFLSPSQK